MSFGLCLPVILASEGGYTFDVGGATQLGITQRILSDYLGRSSTIADVKALTPETVAPIYQEMFWTPAKCDMLGQGPDLMHFDAAVNQGQGRAVRILQAALGIPQDGVFGAQTQLALKGALKTMGPVGLINAMRAERELIYKSTTDFDV